MPIMLLLVAFAALCAVAVVLAGREAPTPEFPADRAPFDLPPDRALTADELSDVRFAVGFRGYRMDQVDEVLDRLTAELAERDRRLAELAPSTPAGDAEQPATEDASPGPGDRIGD